MLSFPSCEECGFGPFYPFSSYLYGSNFYKDGRCDKKYQNGIILCPEEYHILSFAIKIEATILAHLLISLGKSKIGAICDSKFPWATSKRLALSHFFTGGKYLEDFLPALPEYGSGKKEF